MKLKLILIALLLSTSAFAQDATPTPIPPPSRTDAALVQVAPTPAPSEKPAVAPTAVPQRFYLEVDQADLNALSQALNELPKRIADPLLLKFNGQLQAQEQLKAAADKSLVDATEKARKRK